MKAWRIRGKKAHHVSADIRQRGKNGQRDGSMTAHQLRAHAADKRIVFERAQRIMPAPEEQLARSFTTFILTPVSARIRSLQIILGGRLAALGRVRTDGLDVVPEQLLGRAGGRRCRRAQMLERGRVLLSH